MTNIEKLKDKTDRELLEFIILNQINLAQRIFRMNDFFLEHFGEKYIDKLEHKEYIYEKLEEEFEEIKSQLEGF